MLYPEQQITDIQEAAAYIEKYHVNYISCSTLLLNEFNRAKQLPGVKLYLNGGDTLKKSHIDKLLEHSRVGNTFGSTEQTVCCALYEVQASDEMIPVGSPVIGRSLCFTGRYNLRNRATGRIMCSRSGIATGYWKREDLTQEVFRKSF